MRIALAERGRWRSRKPESDQTHERVVGVGSGGVVDGLTCRAIRLRALLVKVPFQSS
jgi:hypothetical protein